LYNPIGDRTVAELGTNWRSRGTCLRLPRCGRHNEVTFKKKLAHDSALFVATTSDEKSINYEAEFVIRPATPVVLCIKMEPGQMSNEWCVDCCTTTIKSPWWPQIEICRPFWWTFDRVLNEFKVLRDVPHHREFHIQSEVTGHMLTDRSMLRKGCEPMFEWADPAMKGRRYTMYEARPPPYYFTGKRKADRLNDYVATNEPCPFCYANDQLSTVADASGSDDTKE